MILGEIYELVSSKNYPHLIGRNFKLLYTRNGIGVFSLTGENRDISMFINKNNVFTLVNKQLELFE